MVFSVILDNSRIIPDEECIALKYKAHVEWCIVYCKENNLCRCIYTHITHKIPEYLLKNE